MPSVLRTFPEISRVGHVETLWSVSLIPANIQYLRIQSVAAAAVLSNPANMMDIVIYVSPDGTDGTQREVWREPWHGGLHRRKPDFVEVPNAIDQTFGPLAPYIGWRLKIGADIPLAMVVGATVTALP